MKCLEQKCYPALCLAIFWSQRVGLIYQYCYPNSLLTSDAVAAANAEAHQGF